jgi:hypothetical protein
VSSPALPLAEQAQSLLCALDALGDSPLFREHVTHSPAEQLPVLALLMDPLRIELRCRCGGALVMWVPALGFAAKWYPHS